MPTGCISFDSYIKPQQEIPYRQRREVVYLLIPTSNHNWRNCACSCQMLYIFWFLHQTTTLTITATRLWSCISFDSYIKPQLGGNERRRNIVVYLLIPTSNHNKLVLRPVLLWLYIFWFLHQTTTWRTTYDKRRMLYIFWFLHQTTTFGWC